ncbi:MAG: ABC transporter transmembrane domain-containing protein, partial [Hyphomicrobiaceae bacterium]
MLHAQFKSRHSEHIDETTPAGACLRPLLAALQWMGRARHLAEALPHFNTVDDVDGLRAVLANINYTSAPRCISTLELHRDMLPCLFEAHGQPLMVVLSIEDGGQIHVFEGSTGSFRTIPASDRKGTAYVVQKIQFENPQDQARSTGWMYGLLSRFRHTFTVLLSLSLVINLLALAVPIYIMGVYEKAIGAQSMVTLVSLFAGVCLVIAAELFLRKIRGRALTYLGTRIENIVVIHVFQKLLHMPVSMTETASIGSQLTRFRQFEGLRDIFSGTLANALLDLPFLAVFIVAVFAIGGPLGFIPVGLVLAYVAMAAITVPMTRSLLQQNGGARTRRRNLMMEITSKYKSIRDNQAGDIWLQRFADANSHFLLSQFRVQQFNVMVQTLAQSLVIVAGGMTIGIGTLLAMDGVLTNGALIAATALVWRGLSPLQSAFLGLNQIGQAIESFRQINHLVRLPQERDPGSLSTLSRTFVGKVTVQDAGLRYTAKTEPALRGVSLRAEAG